MRLQVITNFIPPLVLLLTPVGLQASEVIRHSDEMPNQIATLVTAAPSYPIASEPPTEPEVILTLAEDPDQVLIVADESPKFEGGGLDMFRTWIAESLVYPLEAMNNGIQGQVVVQFIVERDGSLSGIEVLRSPDASLSAEVCRVVGESPLWEPGVHRGAKVRFKFILPIKFKLDTNKPEPTSVDSRPISSDNSLSAETTAAQANPRVSVAKTDMNALLSQKSHETTVDSYPVFMGGDVMAFRAWVLSELQYPEAALSQGAQGLVLIQFIVTAEGKVANMQVLQAPHIALSDEVKRVMRRSPKWEPALKEGKPVSFRFTLPINFEFE